MQYDLGLTAVAILVGMALVFGVVTHFIGTAPNRWEWIIPAIGFFVGGLFVSEVMFATATEATNQPNIDGLSFDEALLGGLVVGLITFVVTRFVTRGPQAHHPAAV